MGRSKAVAKKQKEEEEAMEVDENDEFIMRLLKDDSEVPEAEKSGSDDDQDGDERLQWLRRQVGASSTNAQERPGVSRKTTAADADNEEQGEEQEREEEEGDAGEVQAKRPKKADKGKRRQGEKSPSQQKQQKKQKQQKQQKKQKKQKKQPQSLTGVGDDAGDGDEEAEHAPIVVSGEADGDKEAEADEATVSSGKTVTGYDTTTWNHPVLRLRDACDVARYDARYIAFNTEERVPELKQAKEAAQGRRFGAEQSSTGLASYLERTCPSELPDIIVPPATANTDASKDTGAPASASTDTPSTSSLRRRLHPRLQLPRETLKPLPRHLFEKFDSYRDVFFTERSFSNAKQLREAYVLHVLNHLYKARAYILRHNELLQGSSLTDHEICRDQGFTRPKALILVPYRDHVVQIVKLIAKMACGPTASGKRRDLRHRKRFMREYADLEDGKGPKHPNQEYREYFHGNVDDFFVLGIAVKNLSVSLYSPFNTADLIIASPLGLNHVLQERKSNKESNFLSGIELVVMDQAESFLMQNVEHVMAVFSRLNAKTVAGEVDIGRIRHWALNGLSACMRQTICLSAFATPQLVSIFHKHCCNVAGRLMLSKPYLGTMRHVVHNTLSQVFLRIHSPSYVALPDARFDYFVRHVLPLLQREEAARTIVFIPSYFDFVRVRNHLHKLSIKFTQISDYSERPDVNRARTSFFHGRRPLMLYTERYHYHNRPTIRNARHLVFYELPLFPQFYSEMLNAINGAVAPDATCTVLYSRFEADRLARVVGTQQAIAMLQSSEAKHLFM